MIKRFFRDVFIYSLILFSCTIFAAQLTHKVNISSPLEAKLVPLNLTFAFDAPKDGMPIFDAQIYKNGSFAWAQCSMYIEAKDNNRWTHHIYMGETDNQNLSLVEKLKDKKQQEYFYFKVDLDIASQQSGFEKETVWLKFKYGQFNEQKWETQNSKKPVTKEYIYHPLVYASIPFALIFLVYQWYRLKA